MSVALLDVNVLLALAWPSHTHHNRAHEWFAQSRAAGWATCPMTQCAFVRISSNPRFTEEAQSPAQAAALLASVVALPHHQFWADDVTLFAVGVPIAQLSGYRQIIDAYLLGLAMHHGGILVTFDQGLSSLLTKGSDTQSALLIL